MATFITFLSEYAIPSIVSSGIALLALKFLGDKLINQLLKNESQKYEAKLQEKTTFLKTSLSIYAEEQNISNQRIDNQKANAIHQVYSGMVQVSRPISRIIAGSYFVTDNPDEHITFYHDWAEKGHAASSELSSLLVNHAIYFDEEIYKEISEFSSTSGFAIADFLKTIRQNIAQDISPYEQLKKIETQQVTIKNIYTNELKDMSYKLIKKFRILLGIEKISI